jgi:hypothetical protein
MIVNAIVHVLKIVVLVLAQGMIRENSAGASLAVFCGCSTAPLARRFSSVDGVYLALLVVVPTL